MPHPMRSAEADILLLPGWTGSGPDHWQTRWERKLSTARRVEQHDWERPILNAWVARLAEAVEEATRPVVLIAHSLGINTVAAAADRCHRIDSWDRFEIPLPGARVRILYGEPVFVPADADRDEMEACRRRLESGLRELHERAARGASEAAGQAVEPAGVLIGS